MINISLEEKMTFVNSYIENEVAIELLNAKINQEYEKTILKEFEYLLELSEIKNIENWHKNNNIENTKVTDYQERIIDTKSGKILIGIRFLGMDITKPFINAWSNFPIEKELENIIDIAKKEFKVFKPQYLRFWIKPKSSLYKKYDKYIEQSFYTNAIETICEKKLPPNYDNIELEKIENLDFFEWYKNLYHQFHIEMKDLKFLVAPNDKDDFKSCIEEELIYFIKHQNKTIGLISADKETFISENSIYITDIIIEKEFKGKKFATAAQRKFIELKKDKFKYVWGKISAKNIPSQKNALRLGRKIISSEILLPI